MKLQYRVHRASSHDFPIPGSVTLPSGETVKGNVRHVVVECVPVDHEGSTLRFDFKGSAADEAAKTYHDGDVVEIDVSVAKPAEKAA